MTKMWFGLVTLFPEIFTTLKVGITGKAIEKHLITLETWNPRDFTIDKHKTVDHPPYGGGPGMLMMAAPLTAAIQAAKKAAPTPPTVIYLTPQGRPFNQALATKVSTQGALILVSGRYEGVDERVIENEIDEEWSIGDFILTGGEFAALVVIDTITRLIPNVLGDQTSVFLDSLSSGLLKYPQYTRPRLYKDSPVPDVLLTGDHQSIHRWRLKHSLGKTWLKRPDLLAKRDLDKAEQLLLQEFINEFKQK